MQARKARFLNGQIQLDEPADLTEGMELWVLAPGEDTDEADEELTAEDRAEIEAGIDEGLADAAAGRTHDFKEALAELRSSRP